MILSIIQLCLTLAVTFLQYAREQKIVDAAVASEIAKNVKASNDLLDKVRKARTDAATDFDKRNGVPKPGDPNYRD